MSGSSRVAGAEHGSVKCRARLGAALYCMRAQVWWARAQKKSGLGFEACGCTTLKGAHDRGTALVVATVQGLGSAR